MEDTVKQLMSDVLEVPVDQIGDSMTMDNTDTWDSLRHMELIMAFEEKFGIEVEADELLEMTNLGEIKRVLGDKGVKL